MLDTKQCEVCEMAVRVSWHVMRNNKLLPVSRRKVRHSHYFVMKEPGSGIISDRWKACMC